MLFLPGVRRDGSLADPLESLSGSNRRSFRTLRQKNTTIRAGKELNLHSIPLREAAVPLMVKWRRPSRNRFARFRIGRSTADDLCSGAACCARAWRDAKTTRGTAQCLKNYLEVAVEIAQEAGKSWWKNWSRPSSTFATKRRRGGSRSRRRTSARNVSIVERLHQILSRARHRCRKRELGMESASASEFPLARRSAPTAPRIFAHGYPCFCVSIALAQRDKLLAAVVFNPFYNDLFNRRARRRRHLQPQKIHVSKVATLSTSLLCTGFPGSQPQGQSESSILRRLHATLSRRAPRWLRALDLASVCCRPLRRLLGIRLQNGTRAPPRPSGRKKPRQSERFRQESLPTWRPVILATNGLIHEEMRAMALEISRRAPGPLPFCFARKPLKSLFFFALVWGGGTYITTLHRVLWTYPANAAL